MQFQSLCSSLPLQFCKIRRTLLLPQSLSARYLQSTTVNTGQQSFYDELGIHPQSTSREIKEAFYNLSKDYHPDRNVDNPQALKKFQTISEAYEVLGNPEKRIKYDKGVLGRSSSVAERERATHRFQGEQFYGARGNLKIHRKNNVDRNLDAWVKENSSENFQRLQDQKRYRGRIGYSDSRLTGLSGKSMADKQRMATHSHGNSGTDKSLLLIGVLVLILYALVRIVF